MRHSRLPRIDLPSHPYFLTCCLDRRRPLFRKHMLADLLIGLYANRRERGDILLHGYVVMPDHYHLLISLRGEPSISGLVRNVHSKFGRDCRERFKIKGRIFQRRFYDHVIRDEKDWLTRLAYTHNNPVSADLVENILDWPWSSARYWETGEGPVECDGWE